MLFCFFQYVKRLKSPSEHVMEIELRKGMNKGKFALWLAKLSRRVKLHNMRDGITWQNDKGQT